ncbi:MAG: hypothetical protein EZS28_002186 [Streblomastix strix]|uniref:Uncharacterized protein n=1 Tax=Streblomastix strix TaxID=222440 RepID=A0A5J4X5L6_9EUKA|nr:MAG: hypothetical protein EZS28_002186 [Streblomastix strix]
MSLFIYTLFQMLPFCLPQTVVEVPACVGHLFMKFIELSNPTKKSNLIYNARIESLNTIETDFHLQQNQIMNEPGKMAGLPILTKPKFQKQSNAILLLVPKNQTGSLAPPVAYRLKTQRFPPQPMAKYQVTAQLYGTSYCEVKVTNFFEKDASIGVKLQIINDQRWS